MARVRKYVVRAVRVRVCQLEKPVGECLRAVLFVDDDAISFEFREEGRARFRDVSSFERVVRAVFFERKVGMAR